MQTLRVRSLSLARPQGLAGQVAGQGLVRPTVAHLADKMVGRAGVVGRLAAGVCGVAGETGKQQLLREHG
jgi:hypothetical protein